VKRERARVGYPSSMRSSLPFRRRAVVALAPLLFAAACSNANTTGIPVGSGSSSGASGSSGTSGASSSSGSLGSGDPALDDARAYNLKAINELRAQAGVAALSLDDALDAFAQAASTELSTDHQPHQYFKDHAASCGCGIMAENQGDWNGWTPGPVHQQIDDILQLMMSEGPGGGHHDNIVSPRATRLGVGIVNPGGKMYFTNDFGP
jgi:uncharacterized protein YkwD